MPAMLFAGGVSRAWHWASPPLLQRLYVGRA